MAREFLLYVDKMISNPEYFFKLYKHLFAAGLSIVDVAVYGYIEEWNRGGKPCFCSDDTIGKAFNLERKAILRARQKLHQLGYIQSTKNGRKNVMFVIAREVAATPETDRSVPKRD